MSAYYNEIDPYAAQWLRNLIAAGHIAPGDVDERSIVDVRPGDLRGYTQCHFFAGIGIWSHALRRAGWADDRPVWTGSCPCQPFSVAGQSAEFDDARHLWPAWNGLIREHRPVVVFGEQVASKDALAWLDVVCADLESQGYTVGAIDTCSAGVGAPHIRQRLHFVGDTIKPGLEGLPGHGDHRHGPGWLDANETRPAAKAGADGELADTDGGHPSPEGLQRSGEHGLEQDGRGPVNGFWGGADWIPCRDGKRRPTQPGLFPLASRTPRRMGMLRAYGNGINPEVAAHFIAAYLEVRTQ